MEEMTLWQKIRRYVTWALEAAAGILAVVTGLRALRGADDKQVQSAVDQARSDQRQQDAWEAQRQATAHKVQDLEADQAKLTAQQGEVDARIEAEKQRIAGLSHDQVADELRRFDTPDGRPAKPPGGQS